MAFESSINSMDKAQGPIVRIHIDQTDLDEVLRKCERIRDLTKEATSLAGELASGKFTVKINFECGDE